MMRENRRLPAAALALGLLALLPAAPASAGEAMHLAAGTGPAIPLAPAGQRRSERRILYDARPHDPPAWQIWLPKGLSFTGPDAATALPGIAIDSGGPLRLRAGAGTDGSADRIEMNLLLEFLF